MHINKLKFFGEMLVDVSFICEYTEGKHEGMNVRAEAITSLKFNNYHPWLDYASYEEVRTGACYPQRF